MTAELLPRRQTFQTISWFWDLYTRHLLDLDPPYQRRSVWPQAFKDLFIDTILLRYPAPAIFLFEEMRPDGRATYHVVDGKQRLTTIFEFVGGKYPVSDGAQISSLRGRLFSDLDDDTRKVFWSYQFSVEYLPTTDESIVNSVFDRINRNTARLSHQELRHAKLSGDFITSAEELAVWMETQLPAGFPHILGQSRRQMKDVELVAQLLLLLEHGPRGYSTQELDEAFAARDDEWEAREDISARFQRTVSVLRSLTHGPQGRGFARSRFRNQADFYSLFGAVGSLSAVPNPATLDRWREALLAFSSNVDSEDARSRRKDAALYYDSARSASNDTGPRKNRIAIITRILRKTSGGTPRRKPPGRHK